MARSPPVVGCKYLKNGNVTSVKAGESYDNGCNNCRCGESGIGACTKKFCPTKCTYKHWSGVVGYANPGETELNALENGCRKKCECGFKQLNMGLRKVQLQCPKRCYDPSPPVAGCKYLKSGKVVNVEAGESYNNGCNNCRCGKSGIGACTLMACPDKCGYKHWSGVAGYAKVGEKGLKVLMNGCRKKCECSFKVLDKALRKSQLQCGKRCYGKSKKRKGKRNKRKRGKKRSKKRGKKN